MDAADYLETREDIAAYLDAVLEDRDPELLKAALRAIAREGMTEIAKAAGFGRSNLYKALSPDGNPEFMTVARLMCSRRLGSGCRLRLAPFVADPDAGPGCDFGQLALAPRDIIEHSWFLFEATRGD